MFKRVLLYARQHRANPEVSETLARVVAYLTSQHIEVFLDEDTAGMFKLDLPLLPHTELKSDTDLILVVGGDGNLLSAARFAAPLNIPVLGINRGRLGFLTDISPAKLEQELQAILAGQFQEEKRFLLQIRLTDDQNRPVECLALNDIVLARGKQMHLVCFDVYIDQQFVTHYRSDGLIMATPTGSTAYALSAGGPIMHPQLDAMVMVPLFSHSLSSRPLVIGGLSKLEIKISQANEGDLQLSCDGHESYPVHPGQSLLIEKNPNTLRLLHPITYRYYDTLRIKLGWSAQPTAAVNED